MHKVYGDLYSTLTFGGTQKPVSRGARDERMRQRAEKMHLLMAEGTFAGTQNSRTRVWAARLVLVPVALATGVIAISSAIGEAASKLYVEPFARKESSRHDTGDRR